MTGVDTAEERLMMPKSCGNMASRIRNMSIGSLLGAVASIVLVAGLAGCTGHASGTVAVAPWWEPHLSVDRDLKTRGLREVELIRSRSQSGFLRVTCGYTNESDTTLSSLFRFTWIDESGQPVRSIPGLPEGWRSVHTLPRTRATFSGIAPRDDIQDFRLELIAAHRLKGQPPQSTPDR